MEKRRPPGLGGWPQYPRLRTAHRRPHQRPPGSAPPAAPAARLGAVLLASGRSPVLVASRRDAGRGPCAKLSPPSWWILAARPLPGSRGGSPRTGEADAPVRRRIASNRVFVHAGVVECKAGPSSCRASVMPERGTWWPLSFGPVPATTPMNTPVLDPDGLVHPFARPLSIRSLDGRDLAPCGPEEFGSSAGEDPAAGWSGAGHEYGPVPGGGGPGRCRRDRRSWRCWRSARCLLSSTPKRPCRAHNTVEQARCLEGTRGEAEDVVADCSPPWKRPRERSRLVAQVACRERPWKRMPAHVPKSQGQSDDPRAGRGDPRLRSGAAPSHCLNATAALVWRHCDGTTSIEEWPGKSGSPSQPRW